eukprot:310952_1
MFSNLLFAALTFLSTTELCMAKDLQTSIITHANTSDYDVSVESISITDVATDIADIDSVHNGRPFDVIANLNWEAEVYDTNSTNTLSWELSVDGEVRDTGEVDLRDSRALPTQLAAGRTQFDSSGTHKVEVKITLDDAINNADREYESFAAGASFVPLVLV